MGDQALMPFTVAVVHEVQRFADIIPLGLPHMTTHDIEVQGFYVPKVGLRLSQPHLPTTCHLVATVSVARCGQDWNPSHPVLMATGTECSSLGGRGQESRAGLALSTQSPRSGREDKLERVSALEEAGH